jgi:hypothetical protein
MFKIKKRPSEIVAVLSFLLMGSIPLFSQGSTKISPYVQFQYFKNTDNNRSLQTTLTYSLNRMEIPLPGMEISFFSEASGTKLLGTVLTDEKGVARLEITKETDLPLDSKGFWAFRTEFNGNDTIEAANSDLSIKDVKLEMTLLEVDTIRTISLKAFTSERTKNIPVSGEVIMIYVPRMFSLLPVGEVTLDENGTASLEFPSDIPGNSEGNLTIISKFEEHPTFGNVEVKIVKNWGVPASNSVPVAHRALWTKTAPRWMIITLSILLTGVWGHYLFAVISLIRIKRESKKQKKQKI